MACKECGGLGRKACGLCEGRGKYQKGVHPDFQDTPAAQLKYMNDFGKYDCPRCGGKRTIPCLSCSPRR